jgi:hypothetical protein
MMRSNPVAAVLVGALFLSSLASCWSAAWWFLGARELQNLEYQFQALQRTSSAMQSLANDAIEYSRRNPSIDPLLQKFELKPVSAGQPAAGQPATRPAR